MTSQDDASRCLAGVGHTSTNEQLAIRTFANDDAAAVKALFVIVNRQLAPEDLAELFEDYIAWFLAEEIAGIDRYDALHGGGFWVAHVAEPPLECSASNARMMTPQGFTGCIWNHCFADGVSAGPSTFMPKDWR